MKLILDQGLPRSTVAHLAAAGISAEHVGNMGLAASTDEAILDTARQQQSVVVTLDADFHHLLAISRATSPSVIRIRIEGLKGDQLAAILVQVLAAAGAELAAGAVVSVTPKRVRVRSLPIP
jgi:predicted nuclease of predicted toxin-antitoxin system